MAKTPDMKRILPAAKWCGHCKGAGLVKPMFYEQPCPVCDGAGITAEDDSRLDDLDAKLILLRKVRQLTNKVKSMQPPSPQEPDRYAGASERLGGRYVMD